VVGKGRGRLVAQKMADVVEAWVACPMTSYHSLAWNSSVTSGAQMKNPNPNTWYLASLVTHRTARDYLVYYVMASPHPSITPYL
jgi:hypothetical protein